MSAIASSLWSFWVKNTTYPGEDDNYPLTVVAAPGLMTLLDVALYRSNEGGLTSNVCAANALLCAWIDLKQQAHCLLEALLREAPSRSASAHQRRAAELAESFARLCLDVAFDALDRLTTDKLSQSANNTSESDNEYAATSSSGSALHGVGSQGIAHGVLESIRKAETGRRTLPGEKNRDCWESPLLLCPEYIWADGVLSSCHRLLRTLTKQEFYSDMIMEGITGLSGMCGREAKILAGLVTEDLPLRLHQFRCATEANAVVSKRLYLVKCEYRAPFRAFLEAHQAVQRAPPIELVDTYIALQSNPHELQEKRFRANQVLQDCLEMPALVEALILERQCEQLEVAMAEALFPFTELARILDHKRARIKAVPSVLEFQEISSLQETVRRLKFLLCRKAGLETSTGIRPLLLDIQGAPREEISIPIEMNPFGSYRNCKTEEATLNRLEQLLNQLQCLGRLSKHRNGFQPDKKGDFDISVSIARECNELDVELFQAQFEDWYAMVRRQRELSDAIVQVGHEKVAFTELSERIRRAEIEVSIANAPGPALSVVRQRLESKENDRDKGFEVLKEMIEDVCRREMNVFLSLTPPVKHATLTLPESSVLGIFGIALRMAGEPLPV